MGWFRSVNNHEHLRLSNGYDVENHFRTFHSINSIEARECEPRPVLKDISVVIPTLGRTILEQSLYWILMGNTWPACLIIVEQGSNRELIHWLNIIQSLGMQVKHILLNQRGRSAGINRGLEQVDTPFVAITDDDCFVREDWLWNMTTRLHQHPQAVITGKVEAAGEDMVLVVTSTVPSVQDRPRLKFDSMSGGNMGASLDIFRTAGLFDEDPVIATAEDAEWAYRTLRRGISIRYEPDVVLAHFGWRDTGKRAEQYRAYALSHGGFYGKYLRRGDLFILARVLGHLWRTCRWWMRGTATGNAELAMLGKAYCLHLLPGIRAGLHSKMKPAMLK